MPRWNLRCLLCGRVGNDLVAMQEHAMNDHGFTREQLQLKTSSFCASDNMHYIYSIDGKPWLDAVRVKEEAS